MRNEMLASRRPAPHCNTLQHTTAHCTTLKRCNTCLLRTALPHTCTALPHIATTQQHTTAHCATLTRTETTCNCTTLQHIATCFNNLQHTTARCHALHHIHHMRCLPRTALQHAATHRNTFEHTSYQMPASDRDVRCCAAHSNTSQHI